jgi:hypothetical protein
MQSIIRRFDRAPLEDRLLRANPAQPSRPKDAKGQPAGSPVANRMQRGGKKGKRARERDNAPKSAFATELQGALTEH